MLSDRLYKFVELAFDPWVNNFCVFHYTWNPQSKYFVKIIHDKPRRRLHRLNKVFLIIWILFDIIGLVKSYHNRDFNSLIFIITVLIAVMIVLICWFLCAYLEDAWFSTLYSVIIFLRYFNCKYIIDLHSTLYTLNSYPELI